MDYCEKPTNYTLRRESSGSLNGSGDDKKTGSRVTIPEYNGLPPLPPEQELLEKIKSIHAREIEVEEEVVNWLKLYASLQDAVISFFNENEAGSRLFTLNDWANIYMNPIFIHGNEVGVEGLTKRIQERMTRLISCKLPPARQSPVPNGLDLTPSQLVKRRWSWVQKNVSNSIGEMESRLYLIYAHIFYEKKNRDAVEVFLTQARFLEEHGHLFGAKAIYGALSLNIKPPTNFQEWPELAKDLEKANTRRSALEQEHPELSAQEPIEGS